MPKVIRSLVDFSQGHCFPPTPALNGSLTVFANGFPIVRQGDLYGQNHHCSILHLTHNMGAALLGSTDVFIEGMGVHRDADLIACGDVADNGSQDVFANDGGTAGGVGGNTVGFTVNAPVLTYNYYSIISYVTQYNNVICRKFYIPGSELNGILDVFPGDLYTPIIEEDTGRVIKDYTTPIINVSISPNLPSFLSFPISPESLFCSARVVSKSVSAFLRRVFRLKISSKI